MNRVFIAFYRGRSDHKGLARLADWVTRLVTRSPYSHCEIAVGPQCYDVGTDFTCYSSSFRDGGVRAKTMPLPSDTVSYTRWFPANGSGVIHGVE